MKTLILAILFWGSMIEASSLAVLEVEDKTGTHGVFVQSIPSMIVTELVRSRSEQLVERSRVEAAMREFGFEKSGITKDGGKQIGEWLGADRILVGDLSEYAGMYRLDLRVIETISGQILAASEASMQGESNLMGLVPKAVNSLVKHMAPVPIVLPKVRHGIQKPGFLRIQFKTELSLLTEKNVPFQIVRIFVDGKLVGTSPLINKINEEFVLTNAPLAPGEHVVTMEHGVATKQGQWKRALDVQPESQSLSCLPEKQCVLSYRMNVGVSQFRFGNYQIN